MLVDELVQARHRGGYSTLGTAIIAKAQAPVVTDIVIEKYVHLDGNWVRTGQSWRWLVTAGIGSAEAQHAVFKHFEIQQNTLLKST